MKSPEASNGVESNEPIIVSAVQVVMVRQVEGRELEVFLGLRKAGGFQNQWSTPGGKIDDGETPREAAIREVQEETGVRINIDDLMFVKETSSETKRKEKGKAEPKFKVYRYEFKIYLIDASNMSPKNASPEEHSEAIWVPVSEAIKMHATALAAARGESADMIPGALTPRVAETVGFLNNFGSVEEVIKSLPASNV